MCSFLAVKNETVENEAEGDTEVNAEEMEQALERKEPAEKPDSVEIAKTDAAISAFAKGLTYMTQHPSDGFSASQIEAVEKIIVILTRKKYSLDAIEDECDTVE